MYKKHIEEPANHRGIYLLEVDIVQSLAKKGPCSDHGCDWPCLEVLITSLENHDHRPPVPTFKMVCFRPAKNTRRTNPQINHPTVSKWVLLEDSKSPTFWVQSCCFGSPYPYRLILNRLGVHPKSGMVHTTRMSRKNAGSQQFQSMESLRTI